MASLTRRDNGSYFVQFGPREQRRTVHLGKVNEKLARQAQARIEALASARSLGIPPDQQTALWLDKISCEWSDRLAAVGLTDARQRRTLGGLIREYMAQRPELRPRTVINLETAGKSLVNHFGADRDVRTITRSDADTWAGELKAAYSPATYGRMVKRARQFFAAAIRWRVITDNPFSGVKAPKQSNPARLQFVPADTIRTMIDRTAKQFGLVLAFARFGGLRIPSELPGLRWEEISRTSFTVHAPKTGRRSVPLFPELAEYVDPLRRRSGPVFPNVTDTKNMRARLRRLIDRCGFEPWERLFHNLRASRQTELTARFPAHVVCKWMGNSPVVANEHYLQPLSTDYADAAAQRTAQRTLPISGNLGHPDESNAMQNSRCEGELVGCGIPPTGIVTDNGKSISLNDLRRMLESCAANCAASRLAIAVLRRAG